MESTASRKPMASTTRRDNRVMAEMLPGLCRRRSDFAMLLRPRPRNQADNIIQYCPVLDRQRRHKARAHGLHAIHNRKYALHGRHDFGQSGFFHPVVTRMTTVSPGAMAQPISTST